MRGRCARACVMVAVVWVCALLVPAAAQAQGTEDGCAQGSTALLVRFEGTGQSRQSAPEQTEEVGRTQKPDLDGNADGASQLVHDAGKRLGPAQNSAEALARTGDTTDARPAVCICLAAALLVVAGCALRHRSRSKRARSRKRSLCLYVCVVVVAGVALSVVAAAVPKVQSLAATAFAFELGADGPLAGASVAGQDGVSSELSSSEDHMSQASDPVEDLDFSSRRLVVAMENQPPVGKVLSCFENIWLLSFDSEQEAAQAFEDLRDQAEFEAPDQLVVVAQDSGANKDEDNRKPEVQAGAGTLQNGANTSVHITEAIDAPVGPQANLEALAEQNALWPNAVALVDTGVSGLEEHIVERRSVIGPNVEDNNGHGTRMAQVMREVDPNVQIVSIKAADEQGKATAASVYAAVQMAIDMGVKVVNLSLYAPATAGNAAVEQAIRNAHAAGIAVVGAAGNDGKDAKWYVPGRVGEAVVVGSCDERGDRLQDSNFGDSVDLYVPSAATSVAAAKVSALLRAHGAAGQDPLETLASLPRAFLGFLDQEAQDPTDDDAQNTSMGQDGQTGRDASSSLTETAVDAVSDEPFLVAAGNSSVSMRAEWRRHGIGDDPWKVGGGQDSGGGDTYWYQNVQFKLNNNDGVDGGISYVGFLQSLGASATASNGASCGTGGQRRAMEDIRIWLTGTIAKCYNVNYTVLMANGREYYPQSNTTCSDVVKSYYGWSGFRGKTFSASNGAWSHGDKHDAFSYVAIAPDGSRSTISAAKNQLTGGEVPIRKISVSLSKKSYTHRVLVRYQNADGSWGGYGVARTGSYAYTATVPAWSRAQDATYAAASMAAYTASYANKDVNVSVSRRTATNTIRVRYQNADGSWTGWSNASSGANYVGQVRSWSRAADATYEAASASITGTASNQTKDVSVYRKSYKVAFDANGATQGSMQPETFLVEQQKELPSGGYARDGFLFAGWNTKANGTGTSYADGASLKDVAAAGQTLTLYAQWTAVQMRILVPTALHYVAQENGVARGPDDGVARIENRGNVDVRVEDVRTEVYEPYDAQLGFELERDGPLVPNDSVGLKNVRGTVGQSFAEEREVGCIHWLFAPQL